MKQENYLYKSIVPTISVSIYPEITYFHFNTPMLYAKALSMNSYLSWVSNGIRSAFFIQKAVI